MKSVANNQTRVCMKVELTNWELAEMLMDLIVINSTIKGVIEKYSLGLEEGEELESIFEDLGEASTALDEYFASKRLNVWDGN